MWWPRRAPLYSRQQTQAWRVAARLAQAQAPSVPQPAPAQERWLLTLIAILHAALLLIVGALGLVAASGPLLELGAAWQWFETGVYPAPLLGTVFPGLTEGAVSLLAQLALTKPWLVPPVRQVLMEWVLGMHVGLLGLFLGFGVLWLLVGVEAWIDDMTKHVHARARS